MKSDRGGFRPLRREQLVVEPSGESVGIAARAHRLDGVEERRIA